MNDGSYGAIGMVFEWDCPPPPPEPITAAEATKNLALSYKGLLREIKENKYPYYGYMKSLISDRPQFIFSSDKASESSGAEQPAESADEGFLNFLMTWFTCAKEKCFPVVDKEKSSGSKMHGQQKLGGDNPELAKVRTKFAQCDVASLPKSCSNSLVLLSQLAEFTNAHENSLSLLCFFQRHAANPDFSIYEEFKCCELTLRIEEFAAKSAPQYLSLTITADEEINRYTDSDRGYVGLLKQSTEALKMGLARMHGCRALLKDWWQDEEEWSRFVFLKGVVEKMNKFIDDASRIEESKKKDKEPIFFGQISSKSSSGSGKISSQSSSPPDIPHGFPNQLFSLVAIFLSVITEAKKRWTWNATLFNARNEEWNEIVTNLKKDTIKVREYSASAANEAATRWLRDEISGFCYDVCQDTFHLDASVRPPPPEVCQLPKPAATTLDRRGNLAIDMHPDCEDCIGMRVWLLDEVPTGGFNQYYPKKLSKCNVLIVHVYLRHNMAISRLNQNPENVQAKFLPGTSGAHTNVELPSWVQDACVSQLFYQPLLDYLIHDFVETSSEDAEKRSEPVRLVFTGSAFDAVLATVVASELLNRVNSYRDDPFISKRHSPDEWLKLYSHIRSNIFVLSFMLPAVFTGPHLSPHQSSKALEIDMLTPHEALGINMLNITFSNCVASKIVEHWLSVDRNVLADKIEEWKEATDIDEIVIKSLQKLFSKCQDRTQSHSHFTNSIEQDLSRVIAWAVKTNRTEMCTKMTGTFCADFKASSTDQSRAIRPVNCDKIAKFSTMKDKTGKKNPIEKLRDFASGILHDKYLSEKWQGMLSVCMNPYQLINRSTKDLRSPDDKTLDALASWFLPVIDVYEILPNTSKEKKSNPPRIRQNASYGTLIANRVFDSESFANWQANKRAGESGGRIQMLPQNPDPKARERPAVSAIASRLSVKPLGTRDKPDRLSVQWSCDSTDSHALIRNCFAVTITAYFDPSKTGNFEIQSQTFTGPELKVNQSPPLYSLQCEAELSIPVSCRKKLNEDVKLIPDKGLRYIPLSYDEIIDCTVFVVMLRMRFFSAQFGHGNPRNLHNGFGPELFCFPNRSKSLLNLCMGPNPTSSGAGTSGAQELLQKMNFSNVELKQWMAQQLRIACCRVTLKLESVYERHHRFTPCTERAYDITFCEFVALTAVETSYNSRYIRMRLDELLMQAWDFKLLALNSFGNESDLQECNFSECDSLFQFLDEKCDEDLVKKFRVGSLWSAKLARRCEACSAKSEPETKIRASCKQHWFDYLNDDEHGLDYIRKHSSYLRRLTFSKHVFNKISQLYHNQKRSTPPIFEVPPTNDGFYHKIKAALKSEIDFDRHSLMSTIVSCPDEGNPDGTLMDRSDFQGIWKAFFGDSSLSDFRPRFPTQLYDNEKYEYSTTTQDFRQFPTAVSKDRERAIPACSLSSAFSYNAHHFKSIFRVLETAFQAKPPLSQRTEAEFTSWAHAMGLLRSFAIRQEFEAFCNFFQNANENRSVLSWYKGASTSPDPYLDCLKQMPSIFEIADGSTHVTNGTKSIDDNYMDHEAHIIRLICRRFGFANLSVFQKAIMSREGRKAFKQTISLLPAVVSLERYAMFFFRGRNFWASWITLFIGFMSHIHLLRLWLMKQKRCIAAFGDQKVGKSRFWYKSLGINTVASSNQNTVQTQMWILPRSQFIDFPAFSDENTMGESYNSSDFVRCDISARHLVFDFLLVPDICVFVVKIEAPTVGSLLGLIAHIRQLEMNRYPPSNASNVSFSDQVESSGPARTLSATSRNTSSTGPSGSGFNRLLRENVLFCSFTQNYICRIEPVSPEALRSRGVDPILFETDRDNLDPEHHEILDNLHPDLKKSKFVWLCGQGDRSDDSGYAVKILKKVEANGNRWEIVGQGVPAHGSTVSSHAVLSMMSPREIWLQLREKLSKKKSTIADQVKVNIKNVHLAYFAQYRTQLSSPFDKTVENHIEKDFPWNSAFCQNTDNPELPFDPLNDPSILNARESLTLILRKMLSSVQEKNIEAVIDSILIRPIKVLASTVEDSPPVTICDLCIRDDDIENKREAKYLCGTCGRICDFHKEEHTSKRSLRDHVFTAYVNEEAERIRLAAFDRRTAERDGVDSQFQNSAANRKKRIKIWQVQQESVKIFDQCIQELCGNCARSRESCGHIECLLRDLRALSDVLKFKPSDLESICNDKSNPAQRQERNQDGGIGIVLWSILMGDFNDSHPSGGANLYVGLIKMRARGESFDLKHQAVPRLLRPSFSTDSVHAFMGEDELKSRDDTLSKFVECIDKLWLAVTTDTTRGLQLTIEGILKELREFKTGHLERFSLAPEPSILFPADGAMKQPSSKVVPWFSSIFFRFLEENNCLDMKCLVSNKRPSQAMQLDIASQNVCMALIKVILLPLLASKRSQTRDFGILQNVLTMLEFGESSFVKYLSLEHAILTCMKDNVDSLPISKLLCLEQNHYEDLVTQSVKALRLLFRSVSLKHLVALECLDFNPCVPSFCCEKMYLNLRECISPFSLESSFHLSSSTYCQKGPALKALLSSVETNFAQLEAWVLKPIQKTGGQASQFDHISSKDLVQRVFELSCSVTRRFKSVKHCMQNLVNGSYAAVTVSFSAQFFPTEISLNGRFLMGMKNGDAVTCYVCQPFFRQFECELVVDSTVGKAYLRLPSQIFEQIGISLDMGSFSFIIRNCSTVFVDDKHKIDENVSWCDFLLEHLRGINHTLPLLDCSVELTQPELMDEPCCFVGQQVMMKISFFCDRRLERKVRCFIVLDPEFKYQNGKFQLEFIKNNSSNVQDARRRIECTITKGRLDFVLDFKVADVNRGDIVTVVIPVKNPGSERLKRGACFIYVKRAIKDDAVEVGGPNFDLHPRHDTERCLCFGIAETPEIYHRSIVNCEMLFSKAQLGEDNAKLLLTFESSVDLIVFNPDHPDQIATVDIEMPKAWANMPFCKGAVRKKDCVSLSSENIDFRSEHFQVEVEKDSSNLHVCIGIRSRTQSEKIVSKLAAGRYSIVLEGIVLPSPTQNLIDVLESVRTAEEQLNKTLNPIFSGAISPAPLAETLQSNGDDVFEQQKFKADEERLKLGKAKESLISGCIVSIRDYSGSLVMKSHNFRISPLLLDTEYKHVMERQKFEDSEFKRAHDGPAGQLPCSDIDSFFFANQVMKFIESFVNQKYCGNEAVIKSTQTQNAIAVYRRAISKALDDKNVEKIEKRIRQMQNQGPADGQENLDAVQDRDVVAKVAAMAVQLWSSPFALELDNQKFKFFQILNRHTLATDSKELFENGGIHLIKAIKRNIVTHPDVQTERARAAAGNASAGRVAAVSKPRSAPEKAKAPQHELYYRGGSVPFEMAGFFFPGKIFKFPVFLATSCQLTVALGFALEVENEEERTLWKFSAPPDCLHFKALQENSLVPDEEEFLFPPYSAFRVKSNRRGQILHPVSKKTLHLRFICLEALADNKAPEAQNVPTAPRY